MAKKVPENKLYVCVLIRKDVYRRLKEHIRRAYGPRAYGALSREVEMAIAHWLNEVELGHLTPEPPAAHTHKQYSTGNSGVSTGNGGESRTMRVLRSIVGGVLAIADREIPETTLDRVITRVAGGDGRTLEKYKRLLEAYGVLSVDRVVRDGVRVYSIDVARAREVLE
ncbi:MAG: hypothetical protein QXG57_08800 [Thermofilaceae archaeon]